MPELPRHPDEPCPSRIDLLLAVEGELSQPQWSRMLTHLHRCPACRAHIEGVQMTLAECELQLGQKDDAVDLDVRVFRENLHTEKQAWIHKHPVGAAARRWMPAGATAFLLAISVMLSWPQIQVVRAEGLLRQAAAQELSKTAAGLAQRLLLAPAQVAGRSVAALMDRQHLDSRQPASVAVFMKWRASVPHKRDRIIPTADDNLLVLQTTVTDTPLRSGDISQAEIAIRRDTLDVVRHTLIFAELGRAQFDADAAWIPRDMVALHAEPATASSAAAAALSAADRDLIDRTELDRAELDRLGLDALTKARHAAITPPLAPAFAEYLDRRLGRTTPRRAEYVPGLIAQLAKIRGHFAALQRLAVRFPAVDAQPRSRTTRGRLGRLVRLHYSGLQDSLDIVEAKLALMQGTRPRLLVGSSYRPADWRQRVAAGQPVAAAFERQLRALLTEDSLIWSEASPRDNAPDVAAAFSTLWDAVYAPTTPSAARMTGMRP